MKELTFELDKSIHRVVYIEYHGKRPHSVITDEKNDNGNWDGFMNHFDFELDCKQIEKFMFHNSGSGGKITEIQAPTYAKGTTDVFYWMHPAAKFSGKPKNIKKLPTPIKWNGTANPFKRGRFIYQVNYCKICDKYFDQDLCSDHHSENDKGEIEYPDGSIQD